MKNTAFILRPMEPGDIDSAMKLSTAEGWNQTKKDWKLLIENPCNNCLLADCDGKVIGTTTVINYADQVGWIGMVLVDKDYRGMGVSKSLLTNILERSAHMNAIKLDATPEGKQVYQKFDFKDEYQVVRMVNLSVKKIDLPEDEGALTEAVRKEQIDEIIAFDKNIFGAYRMHLIASLINECPKKAWLLKEKNGISGFVLGRNGNKYHHPGPVFAQCTAAAKKLVSTALKDLLNQPVVVDVLQDKEELIGWLQSAGFIIQRQFTRMYKNENPYPGIPGKQYLIAGPEFG